jgi:hypothetical protein
MSDEPKSTIQLLAEGEALRESYKLRWALAQVENERLRAELAARPAPSPTGAAQEAAKRIIEECKNTYDPTFSVDDVEMVCRAVLAGEGQAARLREAITAALDDYDHRDELSAIDRLRAALDRGR